MSIPPSSAPHPARIPATVWVLGIVSLLMDISSEMVQTLMPLFLVTSLGATPLIVGLIEGAAVAIAMASRLLAGVLSDRLRERKRLALLGYGLAALSRPIFPLADSAAAVMAGRAMDRIGKGIRGAPRDALIADVTPPELRGKSFGLRKSLDTVGGFAGPLIAVALMAASGDDFRLVFWIAVVPALAAVAMLALGVREPEQPSTLKARKPAPLRDAWKLGRPLWVLIAISTALTLARFSEAFLVLRAHELGVPLAWVPLVIVLMHLIYGAFAYPAGVLSDRIGRIPLLLASLALLAAADLVLARDAGVAGLALGVLLWGAHMGCSQGVLATMVADRAPAHLRGTAFGVLSLSGAIAVVAGNAVAGGLWTAYGASATFTTGAVLAGVAFAGLAAWQWRERRMG